MESESIFWARDPLTQVIHFARENTPKSALCGKRWTELVRTGTTIHVWFCGKCEHLLFPDYLDIR